MPKPDFVILFRNRLLVFRRKLLRTLTKMSLHLAMFVILTMVPMVPALPMSHDGGTSLQTKNHDLSVVHYLVKYGHLENKLDMRNNLRSHKTTTMDPFRPYAENEIRNAVKSFQTSLGLKSTGYLDEETTKAMRTPRCGVADKGASEKNLPGIKVTFRRRRRYVLQGTKWSTLTLTWSIFRYHNSPILPKRTQELILDAAFKTWEYGSALKFKYTPNTSKADIVIQFVSHYHGHKSSFDGNGNVLAHAYFPHAGGDIHFDADENWGKDVSLLNVAVHEIGHSIGLKHSGIYDSLMYPTYRVRRSINLDDDDRAGVNAIYGECETKLDGAASVWGSNYFFRAHLVWKTDDYDSKVLPGYPKPISEEFSPRIKSFIDSVLIWSDNNIYFLKDTGSIGYDIYSKSVSYDYPISYDWPGIPNDVDCAISYRSKKVTYFFKGSQYWKFDDITFSTEAGYPKPIKSNWPGIPDNIDAGFYSTWYKKTFFFKGTEYWEYDDATNQGVPQGPIKNKWKNICSAKY